MVTVTAIPSDGDTGCSGLEDILEGRYDVKEEEERLCSSALVTWYSSSSLPLP